MYNSKQNQIIPAAPALSAKPKMNKEKSPIGD